MGIAVNNITILDTDSQQIRLLKSDVIDGVKERDMVTTRIDKLGLQLKAADTETEIQRIERRIQRQETQLFQCKNILKIAIKQLNKATSQEYTEDSDSDMSIASDTGDYSSMSSDDFSDEENSGKSYQKPRARNISTLSRLLGVFSRNDGNARINEQEQSLLDNRFI